MDNHGVLVGWTHHDMGQKLVLNLQTIKQADMPKGKHPVRTAVACVSRLPI